MDISLEYRPCKCTNFDHIKPGLVPKNGTTPESFDSMKAAAFRIREHINAGHSNWAVHHMGMHVSSATINGERFIAR